MDTGMYALDEYLSQMTYVKYRMDAVHRMLGNQYNTPYKYIDIELMVLQIRKIIEHIAMGSMIANRDKYCEYRNKFTDDWKASMIFKDIERINPDFYPRPISISTKNGRDEFIDAQFEYMTKDDAIKIYDKCNGFMHVPNPYGSQPQISYYENMIQEWYKGIASLLDVHTVKLVDDTHMYYVVMQSSETGEPAGTVFEKIIT